jgi:hypothetical protein
MNQFSSQRYDKNLAEKVIFSSEKGENLLDRSLNQHVTIRTTNGKKKGKNILKN